MKDRSTRPATQAETSVQSGMLDTAFGSHQPNFLQSLLIGLSRRTFLHRGKFRHRMTNLIAVLGRPLDITRNGCAYRIEGTNNLIEYGLLLFPDYNGDELRFLNAGLGPNTVALDIGSNVGLYSLPLAKAAGRAVAIDANPSMIDRLGYNARSSGIENLDIVHAAVGERDGMANLHIRKDDVAIINVVEDAEGTIPIRRLDSILADLGITRVDVLKIDVEGFEDVVLAPFLMAAKGDMIPKRIVIERAAAGDYPACTAAFEKLGYQLTGRTRSNSLYLRG
jgi:FkbM family methyltransferase